MYGYSGGVKFRERKKNVNIGQNFVDAMRILERVRSMVSAPAAAAARSTQSAHSDRVFGTEYFIGRKYTGGYG